MRQQRNMFQMKEQDKIPKEKLSEEETGKQHKGRRKEAEKGMAVNPRS